MDKTHELRITSRCRQNPTAPVSLADFVVEPGAPVETEWLVQNPQVSLYCLDVATAQAIFVELPSEVNLAAAPFVYQAQYEGAQRLFTMPYSRLLELSESLETKFERLILIFNISRCGSTLLHQIFNQVPGVVSLSEPDGFIPFWNEGTRLPADESTALMKASAKFLFRPQSFPHLTVPVIKFRARNLTLLKPCHTAFPQATLLFLYRDVLSWYASWARINQRTAQSTNSDKMPLDAVVAWFTANFGTVSLDALGLGNFSDPISLVQWWALGWVVLMDYYLRQTQEGLPITAWRYSNLNHRRQETLSRLFATCGLPPEAVELALAGFERDSQAGSVMARAEESQGNQLQLTEEQKEEIQSLVHCHPILRVGDYIAPGTVM